MDELIERNNELIKNADLLLDCIALLQKREEIKYNECLQNICKEVEQTEKLLATLNETEIADLSKEYEDVMRQMREKQNIMLEYLVKDKKQSIAEEKALKSKEKEKQHLPLPNSRVTSVFKQFTGLEVTPKISMQDYKASPSVYRRIQFELADFDVHIKQKDFNDIPSYMRGRTQIDELRNFLDEVIIPCFNEKHQLMMRPRNTVTNGRDLELWLLYNSQVNLMPGRNFITAGDITRKLGGRIIDKKHQNLLVMLRHLKILQERRISSVTYYIWAVQHN